MRAAARRCGEGTLPPRSTAGNSSAGCLKTGPQYIEKDFRAIFSPELAGRLGVGDGSWADRGFVVQFANEVLERAFDADDNLSEDTKRFINRHVTAGEKQPPAPSVRRGNDQAIRKKA